MQVDPKTGVIIDTTATEKTGSANPNDGETVKADPQTLGAFDPENGGTNDAGDAVISKIPALKIAHGVGEHAGKPGIVAGMLVLGDNTVVAGPPTTPTGAPSLVTVVVHDFRQVWKEYLDSVKYNQYRAENKFGAVFETEEEALAAGFTTRYDDKGTPPTCPPAYFWRLFVLRPTGMESSEFYMCVRDKDGVEAKDQWWAAAKMVVDKGSYGDNATEFAKGIKYADNMAYKDYGYRRAMWQLGTWYGTKSRQANAQKQWRLTCRFLGMMPKESFENLYCQYLGDERLKKLAADLAAKKALASGAKAALPPGQAVA